MHNKQTVISENSVKKQRITKKSSSGSDKNMLLRFVRLKINFALWAAHANMTMLRPFVKNSIACLWRASYITEALRWPLNAWRATPLNTCLQNFQSEPRWAAVAPETINCRTSLFLKLLVAKEPFIIEQLICGILWILLLNCVIQSLFLEIAWGPNYLKNRNFYTFL